jgi:hypothetical protein
MEAVANRDNTVYLGLAGFLDNNKLFNRFITNEPYMGMSIKILHYGIPKEKIDVFPNWTVFIIAYPFWAVNTNYGELDSQNDIMNEICRSSAH